MYVYFPHANWSIAKFHGDKLYKAEHEFTRRLLNDHSLRTHHIHEAKLFFVPTEATATFGNTALIKNAWRLNRLVTTLQSSNAQFNRTWTANQSAHVFFFAGDKGACTVPRGPIMMAHWGLSVPWTYMLAPERTPLKEKVDGACADAHDVIVPPPQNMRQPRLVSFVNSSRRSPGAAWRCELYFAGSVSRAPLGSLCVSRNASASTMEHCYSQGVRQMVWAHHANRSGFCLRATSSDALLHESRFCLAPSAEGFGNRLALAVLAGCVPLIIQPGVLQPLHDLLPYRRFSITLGVEEIPRMHERLAAVTEEEHAEYRRQLERYAPAFAWAAVHSNNSTQPSQPHAQAYEFTRYALCLRAGVECESLRPSLLAD